LNDQKPIGVFLPVVGIQKIGVSSENMEYRIVTATAAIAKPFFCLTIQGAAGGNTSCTLTTRLICASL